MTLTAPQRRVIDALREAQRFSDRVSARSDAARRANETRQAARDVAILRGGHFSGAPKNDVREAVVDFLAEWTRPGEAVGDLLGPGWSTLALEAKGLRVVAAENCGWSARLLDKDRGRAIRAAQAIKPDVEIGDFARIIPKIRTANYDTCGPYLEPTSRDVRAMAAAELRAFVVTVLFSRVEGMKGKPDSHYRRMAKVGLEEDAQDYKIERVIEYRGESNLPMGVFFLRRYGAEKFIASACHPTREAFFGGPECKQCYRQRQKERRATCHPDRQWTTAQGEWHRRCDECYLREKPEQRAICHPHKPRQAHGLCAKCYVVWQRYAASGRAKTASDRRVRDIVAAWDEARRRRAQRSPQGRWELRNQLTQDTARLIAAYGQVA